MKTYVVGDIHGAYLALVQVLSRAPVNKGDRIIFLGDYVDGWSQSAEVVQFLIEFSKEYDCIFIKGNHDMWCEKWLTTGVRDHVWIMNGGQATVDSYINTNHLVSSYHHMFFYKLHNYYIDEQNRGFVHGGFNSKKGLGHEHYKSDYYWDRDLWNLALMQHNNFQDAEEPVLEQVRRFEKHKEVFIGHTTTCNWIAKPHYPEWEEMGKKAAPINIPMHRCNVWNLDTGAGWSGKLTIMDVDTKEYWQSDLVKELYPEEKGRNG